MRQTPVHRALTLLAAIRPERSADEWSSATIGERDAALLGVREELFGESLSATSECPKCSEVLEMTISTRDIKPPALPEAAASRQLLVEGFAIFWRVPTSADILAASSEGRDELIRRCISEVSRDGQAVDPAELPTQAVTTLAAAIGEADPLADIRLSLVCPACRHAWQAAFDIVSYLWSEIDDWAQRLLLDVHTLASAYNWSEREILSMSAVRRQFYLNLQGA